VVVAIILGAMFAEFRKPLLWRLGLVVLVTAVWIMIPWPRAMRRAA
jgi:hypothetical protein